MFDDPNTPDPATPDATAPARLTGPITGPQDPRLADPTYANDPNVLAFLNAHYGADGTAQTQPANSPGWDPQTQTWKPGGDNPGPPPTPTPTPTPTPGAGTGSLIQPFTQPYVPAGSASANPTPLPTVAGSASTIPGAPAFPTIPRFASPTMAEAMDDPGYKFTLDQGNQNLQNWAAARGTLNDSSTAKAMIDYGQGAATTQYGNVWDRALRGYEENVGTQYLAPWQAQYQNWQTGTAAPTMQNFQTNAANVSHLNDVSWQDNWNAYLNKFDIFRDQRDSTFNKQFQTATA